MNPEFNFLDRYTVSQKLMMSYVESNLPISASYICFICFGISIEPLKCSKCMQVCCQKCLIQINYHQGIFCHCEGKTQKENFTNCIIPEIEQTKYIIFDDKTFEICNTYQYKEAIDKFEKFPSVIPQLFFECDSRHFNQFSGFPLQKNEYYKHKYQYSVYCSIIFVKLSTAEHKNHKLKMEKRIKKNISKMINFNYAHGYRNETDDKKSIININKMLTLNKCHFKKIEIRTSEIKSRNKIIEIAKLVRNNRRYLQIFNCTNDIDLSYLYYCNAFNSCNSLKNIRIGEDVYSESKSNLKKLFNDHSKQSSKSCYFFNMKFIQNLSINCIEFLTSENLDSFKLLDSLNYIKLCHCSFTKDHLFSIMQNLLQYKLLKSINLILIEMLDYDNPDVQFENKFVELFIDNSRLESFRIQNVERFTKKCEFYPGSDNLGESHHFQLPFSYIQIPLMVSRLLYLKLTINSEFIPNSILNEFAKYIEATHCLKELSLFLRTPPNSNFEYFKSILHSLSRNNSILKLNLSYQKGLRDYSLNIIQLIRDNQRIKKLNLSHCDFKISEDFANALVSNDSLEELNISEIPIDNEKGVLPLMFKSKLKRIYIGYSYFFHLIFKNDPNRKIVYE